MEQPKSKRRLRLTPAATAVSLAILVIAIPLVLILLDAVITPPRMQKHKWMLTETLGLGITPLDMLKTSVGEMDKRLQAKGFERASELESYPDYWLGWRREGIELIYSTRNRHYLIIYNFDAKRPSNWRLDSGVRLGQSDSDVQATYGIPDSAFLQYFTYTYVLNGRQYIRASFSFDERRSLVRVGYVFRQRSYWDRLFFRI